MKTALIIIWLIILTIFMLRIHEQMKERPTNSEFINLEKEVQTELKQNQDETIQKIKALFKDVRIIPVSTGALVVMEREKDKE